MHAVPIALLAAALGSSMALAPAPATPDAKLEACKARCNATESETDQATCRLTCREAAQEKDRAHIILWTEERAVGGLVPGQQAPSAPTTTITHVTPDGATTQVVGPAVDTPPAEPLSARERYYFGLVDCQDGCEDTQDPLARARCKLRCVRQRPGPVPPGPSRTQPRRPVVAAPSGASQTAPVPGHVIDCAAQCRGEPTDDDRMTCEHRCSTAQQRRRAAPVSSAKTAPVAQPSKAQCRAECRARAGACRSECSTQGDDASTCRLQCDEASSACERRCK